ncbi:MAG: endonuclease VIII [Wenzhouxiangellaceae bacterium]|nr:endonuclease VIII [Wenzhouxiangellaceae bacterium]
MPEGPEMYRVARRITDEIGGRRMTEVWFAFDELKPWQAELQGRKFERAETRGKALLLRFATGPTIYTHNQLYGRWMFSEPDRRPDTNRQLRLALSSADRSALLYSASEIDVIEPGEEDAHPFLSSIGLDILSSGADRFEVIDWMARDEFANRQLGGLLLDQSFLAGVGNYLRSEILFHARLRPGQRIRDLDAEGLRRLAESACLMIRRAARTEGITNDRSRVVKLKKAGWKRGDYRHFVFGRDGQACFECDGEVRKTRVASRRLYWCPGCQGKRGDR